MFVTSYILVVRFFRDSNMMVRKRIKDQHRCKILFGQICTWRFRPSVCSHIYLSIMGTNGLFIEDGEVLASLKTGQEVEYNLLQFSIWCLWDLSVGPEWKMKSSEVDSILLNYIAESRIKKKLSQTPNSLDGCQQVLVLAKNVLQESLLKLCDLAGLHLVQVTSDTSVNDRDLLLNGHRGWKGHSLMVSPRLPSQSFD